MNVVVTGGAGFIGSRLVGRLLADGHQVHVVDDLSLGSKDNLAAYAQSAGLSVAVMDCRDAEFKKLCTAVRPDRVFHLAANSDISKGSADPRTDLERTFLTTYGVLEAMRAAGSKELIFASTSAVYGEVPGDIREDHGPLEPISQYGAAKLASEAYVSAHCHLYGMKTWVFRFPNVVGPNLTHGAIYDLVRRLMHDKTRLSVLGDGTQNKPYLHVDDLLDAIFLGASRPAEPLATYNVAGEGMTSVREIAEAVRELSGLKDAVIEYGKGNRGWPGDVPHFSYDTARIRSLGWKPRRSSNEAVRAAIAAEVERCRRSS